MGGGAAYRKASLVSAVMLARIGPVKPFLANDLIAHSERCGRNERAAHAQPLRSRSVNTSARARPREGDAKGAHRCVSAVSAEIVGGTLPTRPG